MDNNKVITLEIVREKGITINSEDLKYAYFFSLFLNTYTLVHSLSSSVNSSFHIVGTTIENVFIL